MRSSMVDGGLRRAMGWSGPRTPGAGIAPSRADTAFGGGPPMVVGAVRASGTGRALRMSRRAAAVALAAFCFSAPVVARAQDAGVAIGTAAPRSLPVERLDGTRADLGPLFGKGPVLLQFWAAWCSSCHELAPKVAAARTKYGEKVKFVGVAVAVNQSPTLARRYSEKHKTPLDLYYDRDGAAAEAFEAPGTSYVVLLDKDGKVAYTGFGPDQNLDAAIRKVLAMPAKSSD